MDEAAPTSRLEHLPRELRDRIYFFLLDDTFRIDCCHSLKDPPLSRTSHFLRNEILPIAFRHLSLQRISRLCKPLNIKTWLLPDGPAASRLAATRTLTIGVDEESGYNEKPLPVRTYEEGKWGTMLPALLSYFQDRPGPQLHRLTVCVAGKKKCRDSDTFSRDLESRRPHQCHFIDTSEFYHSFINDLARHPVADAIELKGIFPPDWTTFLGCHGGVAITQDFMDFIAECKLYQSLVGPHHRNELEQLEQEAAGELGYDQSIAWEQRLRLLHSTLETAWKAKIIASMEYFRGREDVTESRFSFHTA